MGRDPEEPYPGTPEAKKLGCACKIINGVRVDIDGLPIWQRMIGCPYHDVSIYNPPIGGGLVSKG